VIHRENTNDSFTDSYNQIRLSSAPHRVAGGAAASPRGAVAHASVHTQARLQAAVAVEAVSAGLVTEQPRPPGLARALSFHWVAAGEKIEANVMKSLLNVQGKCEKCNCRGSNASVRGSNASVRAVMQL